MSSADRLLRFRAAFSAERVKLLTKGAPLSAFVLPSTDAHQSEYLADVDFRVRFLSGFSGSNAYVVVTDEQALLWTDGRYFVQAGKQLDSKWTLMKQGLPDVLEPSDWLTQNLPPSSVVGFDPDLFTYEGGRNMFEKLNKLGLHPVSIAGNLVDDIWTDRPKPASAKLVVLPVEVSGKSTDEKLNLMREKAAKMKCTASVYAALDDIMWLLNVRGSDIPHNPLAYSYLLVSQDEAHLFIDDRKLDDKIRAHISSVQIHPYEVAAVWMSQWHQSQKEKEGYRVLVPVTTNYSIGSIFEGFMVTDVSPAEVAKAVKNPVEMAGMRTCHIRDSAILCEFLMWLEGELLSGKSYTEIEVAKKVDAFRAAHEKYMDLSFSTISAAGDHAALPHYHAEGEDGERPVVKDQVYLVDSGGHYKDGTTDVTRTVWVGDEAKIPADFIQHNTLVLKGHINLAKTNFPDNIQGIRLDTLSRHALWNVGLDFGHGTGHGVGHFLNVHEGPASIGYRTSSPKGQVHAGMVLTIEPGYYLPGNWGIRIENCYETVGAKVASGADNFLTFASLTLVPIQLAIVDKTLLTDGEVAWLNAYHERVLSVVGDYLKSKGKSEVYEWLAQQCKKI